MLTRYKNNKPWYYLKNYLRMTFCPSWIYRAKLSRMLNSWDTFDRSYVEDRVNYYNKQNTPFEPRGNVTTIAQFNKPRFGKIPLKVYFFDSREYLRYFDPKLRFAHLFGDVNWITEEGPTIVKSRPIGENNQNNVLLKFDKIRHFLFIRDEYDYSEKKDLLVWRGATRARPHRIKLLEDYQNHPMFDIGKTDRDGDHLEFCRPTMTLKEQLRYKFILSIEGFDVATNLKWILSSNSLCFMTTPKYETWFMEGRLKPDYHYVLLKEDYSDVEEKVKYYLEYPEKAQQIIKQAHEYIDQFRNKKREDLISLLVLNKYFKLCQNSPS